MMSEGIDQHNLSIDDIRRLCEKAMWSNYFGVEFRRWLLHEISFGSVRITGWGETISDAMQRHYNFYAEHDPTVLMDLKKMIEKAIAGDLMTIAQTCQPPTYWERR